MKKKLINVLLFISLLVHPTCSKSISKFPQKEDKSENVQESEIWKRVAIANRNRIWDDGVMPYEIGPNISDSLHDTILRSMDIWESKSCIKFVPAEQSHKYRIIITGIGSCGCCSIVGKFQAKQLVVFHELCNEVRAVLHELTHALGFYHEQRRPDRDKYVKVLYDNIKKGRESNFNKLSEEQVDTLGLSYDFNSIMHYSSYGWNIAAGKQTIRPLNESIPIIGKNMKLSKMDITATNILYKCPQCYFKLKKKIGKIQLSASNLPSEKGYCQWFIKRDPGEFIEFYVENVDIPDSDGCSTNYLQFQDGYLPTSPVMDRICGRQKSKKNYKTSSSYLLISYNSSSTNSKHQEFFLNYQVVCNGKIKGDFGSIQSPNFNELYLNDSICKWILEVPLGAKVVLTFERFHIKYNENCQSDYVEVIDVDKDSGNLLTKRFCGNEMPDVILSNTNQLAVRYVSEKRNLENKFSAYFFKEINECELPDRGGCRDICINSIGSYRCECFEGHVWVNITESCEKIINSCGGTIVENETIVIASPGYPDPYPSNINCTWKINQKKLNLKFLSMDINVSKDECINQLIVTAGSGYKKVYCDFEGISELKIKYASNLQIQFVSKEIVTRNGFQILVQPM